MTVAGRTVQAVMMAAGRNEEQELRTVVGRTVQAVMMAAGRNEEEEVRIVANVYDDNDFQYSLLLFGQCTYIP